jgi:hypothetical protein
MAIRAGKQQKLGEINEMTDYSESLIKITALVRQYRKLVLNGKYDAAADVAIDMQIAVVELQEWSEAKFEQSTAAAL